MFVSEIIDRKESHIRTVGPDEPLEFCAAHMKLQGVGALVVCEHGRHLCGLLSERHILGAVVDHGPRALQMTAGEVMDPLPVTCARDDTVAAVARRMTQARVRHVPVIEEGAIVGIVSIGDIVKERFEEMELERGVLRDMAGAHISAM
ncbi:CBS domain-containing protein [Psychromarinibacter sp. S121]|uniref:CBS domain-containing protein n=1 Tax=Psychromarinibacter sp. S121 TaxID=3415127 RepID=UPI003C7B33EF